MKQHVPNGQLVFALALLAFAFTLPTHVHAQSLFFSNTKKKPAVAEKRAGTAKKAGSVSLGKSSGLLAISPNTQEKAAEEKVVKIAPAAVIDRDGEVLLNLRERGAPSSKVIGQINPSEATAVRIGRYWVKVETANEQGGWVKKDLWFKYRPDAPLRPEGEDDPAVDTSTEATFIDKTARCLSGKCGQGIRVAGQSEIVVPGKPLSYASILTKRRRNARTNLCWRGVWESLKAAGLVRGELTQDSAKNALVDLRKFGFVHDRNACNSPGVVRVYDPPSKAWLNKNIKKRKRTAGDTHGHIEFLMTNGRWHHFTTTDTPINHSSRFGPQRRILKYCLVKKG